MGLRNFLKRLYWMAKKEKLFPVIQCTDERQLLKNKVALIVGGSGGIGLAVARSFLQSGARVIICGTSEKKLNTIYQSFSPEDRMCVKTVLLDLRETGRFREIVERCFLLWGGVDILVNCAGVHTDNVDFWTMTESEYERVMDINLKSVFFICQTVAERMKRAGIKGHILLVSSTRGFEPAWSPYGISKWGLNGFVLGLSKIVLPYGIVVNGIAPGSTATKLIGVKEGDSLYTAENGLNRLVLPEEIAQYAKILVSGLGDVLAGETIRLGAGRGVFDIR